LDHSTHNQIPEPSLLDICTQAGMSPLLIGLTVIFVAMSIFYVFRLFNGKAISICCGTFSPWNEVVHILGGLVMVGMVVPKAFTGVYALMAISCLLVALGYALYLLSNSGPIRFWKFLHVNMYLSMALMSAVMAGSFSIGTLGVMYGVVVNIVALAYFGKAIPYCLSHKPPLLFALGSNIFHVIMAGVMILMFVFPETFMIGHAHH
jgi:hypothetical protein